MYQVPYPETWASKGINQRGRCFVQRSESGQGFRCCSPWTWEKLRVKVFINARTLPSVWSLSCKSLSAERGGRKLLRGPSICLFEKSGVGEAHSHRALGKRIRTCGPLVICVYSSVWCVWEEGAGQPEVGESKPFEDRPSFWNGSGIPSLAQCPTVVCMLLSPSPFACVLSTAFAGRNTGMQKCDVLWISTTKHLLSWASFCVIAGTLATSAAAAAKLLQSCLTLCNPVDGSPPGSTVPGNLQARTLEWATISFSSAWKWTMKVKSLSCVQLFTTPWTAAHQAPLPMGFSRQEYWSGVPLPSPLLLGRLKWKASQLVVSPQPSAAKASNAFRGGGMHTMALGQRTGGVVLALVVPQWGLPHSQWHWPVSLLPASRSIHSLRLVPPLLSLLTMAPCQASSDPKPPSRMERMYPLGFQTLWRSSQSLFS